MFFKCWHLSFGNEIYRKSGIFLVEIFANYQNRTIFALQLRK